MGRRSVKVRLLGGSVERRWLEDELKMLEPEWREEERLATIADKLALPSEIDAARDQLKP